MNHGWARTQSFQPLSFSPHEGQQPLRRLELRTEDGQPEEHDEPSGTGEGHEGQSAEDQDHPEGKDHDTVCRERRRPLSDRPAPGPVVGVIGVSQEVVVLGRGVGSSAMSGNGRWLSALPSRVDPPDLLGPPHLVEDPGHRAG